ncbi:BMP family ABC transporter substrate-binding protein [Pseudonocardiaceae bacterium YIM PH 21723]|nr:BMP family ABC transporter substrate-binding protein [Pseudonocardiaceae bacterium YIM PH 21723]
MRKLAFLLVAALLVLGACTKPTAGGSSGSGCRLNPVPAAAESPSLTPSAAPAPGAGSAGLRVALAMTTGRGDGGYNDSAAVGLDRAAKEFGLTGIRESSTPPNEAPAATAARLRSLAAEGFNPIIALGYGYIEPLQIVAKEFPGTRFASIDAEGTGPNIVNLRFSDEQAAFLTGVIAAYQSRTCHVGFVGGVNAPGIHKFDAGFTQGATAAAPDIKVEHRYLTSAGDLSGFNDPARGAEAAKGQIDAGADVLFHAAGRSGKGVLGAAHDAKVSGIGVDADQYNEPALAEYRDAIISSLLKRMDTAVYSYIRAVVTGSLDRLPSTFDLSNDGVGVATSGGRIDGIRDQLAAYQAAIVRGEITVKTG